ncbi:NADH dehydrogenase [Pajaroellobacter abortibovis]|uniref:NADH dehydrogenase n=2 Tax=Pajaroellobacter abortibovis TaxID=1882918 RepID=A0A1L6MXF2_9BACT|nr:NADH dehydrogenase [Pajaroellobacter abortibovis]
MPTFQLDGTSIPFEPGETIIKAAYRQGIEIPHYCWHPGLSVAANCRMCLVEVVPPPGQRPIMLDVLEWDSHLNEYVPRVKLKLQPACQLTAAEGMEIRSETSPYVATARKGVQEFLLLNHPVDCPICDQSGECKLQDYWLEYGRFQKRMRDEPIHKPKAVVFGPTIVYDAERCVMCTRCIRFMDEIAKDHVLDMRQRGNLNEITVASGRQLDGRYTFMTEYVCPVGALTTKDFRFKARVWFLRSAESICQGCATGCNAYLDYDPRSNRIYRYRPRPNEEVNQYWMCDNGMLSYQRAHQERVLKAHVQGTATSIEQALDFIQKQVDEKTLGSMGILFSAQHSLEDNWALFQLGALLCGSTRLYMTGMGEGYEDDILIHRDKNSNTQGVLHLVPDVKLFSELLEHVRSGLVTGVLALGGATPGERATDAAVLRSLSFLVTVAAHQGALVDAAHVVLPAVSWAEADGTYVNAQGLHQVSKKAIKPAGDTQPGWQLLAKLAHRLGFEVDWSSLRAGYSLSSHGRSNSSFPASQASPVSS